MLLKSEGAGLAIHGLDPEAKKVIGSLAGNRPVILARATYASYPATQTNTIMSYTFPPLALRPGDQIRLKLYGTDTNPSAFVDLFDPVVQVVQDGVTQFLEAVHAGIDHTTTNPVSWCLDAALSFNIPKASGQYVPHANSNAVTVGGTYSSGLSPNDAIMMSGYMSLTVTNSADFAATTTGGQPVSTAATGTFQISTRDANQTTLSNARPLMVGVQITTGSFNTYTVQGGWMEGL